MTVDLGTSYFKVCLFNCKGELEFLQKVAAPVKEASDGHVEIDVIEFQDCISDAVQALGRQAGSLMSVGAVSFATQANSFALFDQEDEPLTPFILWADGRARDEVTLCEKLASTSGFYQTTGVAQLSHLFFPAKLAWLRRNDPSLLQSTARVGFISDYLTCWLTGDWLTEAAVAGLTGLANIHTLHWWQDTCSMVELPVHKLPRIVRAGNVVGTIKPHLASKWGLRPDCRFVVGCLDQFAGALGAGVVTPDKILENTGTVLATVRCDQQFDPNPRAPVFQGPSYRQGLYYRMAFSELSAGILERYRNCRAPELSFEQLDRLAATVPSGAEGLKLRTDAFSRPLDQIFESHTGHHTQAHEVRAILEAVANELRKQVYTLGGDKLPTEVVSAGGAACSQLWLKIKSEAVGCPVTAVDCRESASRGAALLALSGISGSSPEELALTFETARTPDMS